MRQQRNRLLGHASSGTARCPDRFAFSHSANFGGSEQVLLQLVRELTGERNTACAEVVRAGREALQETTADAAPAPVLVTGASYRPPPMRFSCPRHSGRARFRVSSPGQTEELPTRRRFRGAEAPARLPSLEDLRKCSDPPFQMDTSTLLS